MEVQIAKSALSEALATLVAGAGSSIKQKDFGWMTAKSDSVTLLLNTLGDIIEIDIPAIVVKPGVTSIPVKQIVDTVEHASGDTITLKPTGHNLSLTSNGTTVGRFQSLPMSFPPTTWKQPQQSAIVASAANFRGILQRAQRALSDGPKSGSPHLLFVQIAFSRNRVDASAACNYKIGNASAIDFDITVEGTTYLPIEQLPRVMGILGHIEESITIGLDPGRFSISAGVTRYSTAGPAENPPSYLSMFSTFGPNSAEITGKDLRRALGAIAPGISGQPNAGTGCVDVKILPTEFRLRAKDGNLVQEFIPAVANKELATCFAHAHMMSAAIGADKITLRYSDDPLAPVHWIHEDDDLHARFIVCAARRN